MKKVLHMVTVSSSLKLMEGQLKYLKENGFEVGAVSSPGKELDESTADFKKAIPMAREIAPISDIVSLFKLIKYISREQIDIVNAGTPKAGLLGILASFLARVPTRIYTLRGLRFETERGVKRIMLLLIEKIACLLATEVICISPSLLKEAKSKGLIKNKGLLFLKGSSNGIDMKRYPLIEEIEEEIYDLKAKIGFGENDFVLGFVGRITKDKGIKELLNSFLILQQEYDDIKLLILGGKDEDSEFVRKVILELNNNKSIFYLGYVNQPQRYYYLMDLLIFPTYREGFGNVSIQAQAAKVPVIATNVTGARDTIIDNITGLLIEPFSEDEIIEKVIYLKENNAVRIEFGEKGREFTENNFQSKMIWDELIKLYEK